jgi:hypothetical protein
VGHGWAVDNTDYDEEWFEGTDEQTFRPWSGDLPVDPSHGTYLVSAVGTFHNGRVVAAFLYPHDSHEIGLLQPHVFVGGRAFGFWGGILGTPQHTRDEFFELLGLQREEVFPIWIEASDQLARGVVSARVPSCLPDASTEPMAAERRRRWWRRR